MKDNILYDDNLQGNMLSNLQAMLDEALQAPDEERDYDSIAEITAAIAEIAGESISDDTVSVRAQETAEQVVNTCRRKRISRVVKWAAALSACFAIRSGSRGSHLLPEGGLFGSGSAITRMTCPFPKLHIAVKELCEMPLGLSLAGVSAAVDRKRHKGC